MKKIYFLLLTLVLASCDSDKIETITIDNQFSVELPSFLSEANDLHDDASLQYQNLFKEFYIVIIDEPKDEFNQIAKNIDYSADLNGYYAILHSGLNEDIQNAQFTEPKDTQINGLKAKTFSVSGEIDKIKVYYNIAYIEGKNKYYQVVSWTLTSNKEKYEEVMKKIITSFKEIGTQRSSDRSKK